MAVDNTAVILEGY